MVLNAYNYPEKCFTKLDLNNPFYKTEFQNVCPLNRGKTERNCIYPRKEIITKKFCKRIKDRCRK